MVVAIGDGTKEHPWKLKTPPNTSAYEMWRDETANPPALVCQVGGRAVPRLAIGVSCRSHSSLVGSRHSNPPRGFERALHLAIDRGRC
jgi:hypothetical protein